MQRKQEHTLLNTIPLGLLMTLALMGTYTIPFVIGAVVEGMGWDPSRASALGTTEILGIAAGGIASSLLFNLEKGFGKAAGSALLIGAVAQFLSAHAQDYPTLLILRSLAGLSQGVLIAVVNTLVARTTQPERVYGLVFTTSSSCFALLLFALQYGEHTGLFYSLSVIFTLGLALVGKLHTPPQGAAEGEHSNPSKVFWPLLLYFFCILSIVYVILGGTWAFTERVAVRIDIDRKTIGVLLGFSTLAGVAGAASAARVGSSWGYSRPLVLAYIASGVTVLSITLATSVTLYAAGIILYGYLYMFAISFALGITAHLDRTGRIAARTNSFILIPYSFGPLLFGIVGLDNLAVLGGWCFIACVGAAMLSSDFIRRLDLA